MRRPKIDPLIARFDALILDLARALARADAARDHSAETTEREPCASPSTPYISPGSGRPALDELELAVSARIGLI